jgi:hypothetical protein
VLAAISRFDKAMTVAKLLGAPEHKRREVGKCEGRKSPRRAERTRSAISPRRHQLDAQQMKDPPRLENLSGSRVFYVRGDDE